MDNEAYVKDVGKECEVVKNGDIQNDILPQKDLQAHTFEDAIALTECGKFHYQLLWTGGLCFLTVMSQILCISMILPAVKCDISATLEEQGLFASAALFGVVCGSHAMGFLADTWGRVRTLKWSLILSTITGVISAFSPDIWTLIVTRFLTGLFSAGCQACVFSLCSEFHSNKTRARHVTLISMFLSMSIVYISIEAVVILPVHITFTLFGMIMSSWRFMLLAVNISPILALILLHFTPETPKYELIHGNHDGALNTLRQMFARNTGRPMEEYPVKNIQLEKSGANIADIHNIKDALKMIWNQTVPVFYKERILHTLNICLVLFFTYGIPHGLFMWYPTILNDEVKRDGDELCQVISEVDLLASESSNFCNGQADSLTYWLLAFLGTVFTVVYLVFAYTIDIVGKRNILIFYDVLCGALCLAVQYISSLPLAVVVLTIICSVVNCAGIVGTIAVEFYPTNINAMAMCFVMMIGRLGAVAGNNIFGYFLFDHCLWTFRIVAILLFVIAFMSWLLPEKKRERRLFKNRKP